MTQAFPRNPRDLYAAEQVLLGGTRLWASKSEAPDQAFESVERYYELFDVKGAARSHVAILSNCMLAGRRRMCVNALCNPSLTLDESHEVHMVAYAQRGDAEKAAGILSNWLPTSAVRLTMPAVKALGEAMVAKKLVASLRPWSCAPDFCDIAQARATPVETSLLAH